MKSFLRRKIRKAMVEGKQPENEPPLSPSPAASGSPDIIEAAFTERNLPTLVEADSQGTGLLGALQARTYRVDSEVAHGGMGVIFHARDLNLRRSVAMKVVLSDKEKSPQHLLRFLQEAQLTAQLEHPNIVPVHELSVNDQGKPYYTMKFVKGVTLREVLEKIKAGDPETLAKYSLGHLLTAFQKVCDAVAFAHSRGVIHRDLKPDNIMLGDYGEVLVMDWGLAKVLNSANVEHPTSNTEHRTPTQSSVLSPQSSDLTLSGQILGSPQFMSPEQAEGKVDEIDARTDIFALGGILYNILTLHPPVSPLLAPSSFGTVSFEFGTVGNPGNAADSTTYGAVSYAYNISKHEVSNAQYVEFLNTVDSTGANSLNLYSASMTSDALGGINFSAGAANGSKYSSKTGQGNDPVVFVNFFDSMRFVNWLHNGQISGGTENGVYEA